MAMTPETNYPLLKQRGFTMIELLVVMAVIAILSGFIVAGVMLAKKKAKEQAAQIKCTNIALGVQRLMSTINASNQPMMERLTAKFPTLKDPFQQAAYFKIDWELQPTNPRWHALMNPANPDGPYFPRVNSRLKLGKDQDKDKVGNYEFYDLVEFNDKEIMTDPKTNFPHAFDPWKMSQYVYFCYYASSSSDRYLVDGILALGLDGQYTDPGMGAVNDGDPSAGSYWSPDNLNDQYNKDNKWAPIGRYLRK
jgi:prepilin-type N-terminal cleavage/methylation domain-containing protein